MSFVAGFSKIKLQFGHSISILEKRCEVVKKLPLFTLILQTALLP